MYYFIRNRFLYAAVASVLAGGFMIFLEAIFSGSLFEFYPHTFIWLLSTMMCAAVLALLLWPRPDLRTKKRMATTGLLIGLITLSVMCLAFGFSQTSMIDSGGVPDLEYKIVFSLLFFLVTLFYSAFAPLWLGILAALFVATKNKS